MVGNVPSNLDGQSEKTKVSLLVEFIRNEFVGIVRRRKLHHFYLLALSFLGYKAASRAVVLYVGGDNESRQPEEESDELELLLLILILA